LKNLGAILESTTPLNQEYLSEFVAECRKPDAETYKLLNHRFLQGFPSSSNAGGDESSLSSQLLSVEHSGRLIKEYNVLDFLGRGGFGEVYLARFVQ
jgi:hypothetical protein